MELITAFVTANFTAIIIAYAIGALLSTFGMGFLFKVLGEMNVYDYLLAVGSGLLFPIVVPIFVLYSLAIASSHTVKLLLGKEEES